MCQGQGHTTARKEDGLAACFALSLLLSNRKDLRRWPYHHLDLNAGCGENERVGCRGSPLIFLDQAAAVGRPVEAFFIDSNPTYVEQLRARLEGYPLPPFIRVRAECHDNARFLPRWGELIAEKENPRFAVGTVLCDPNGFREGFPAAALATFAGRFPRIDLILNLNLNLFRAALGCKRRGKKGFEEWPSLEEVIEPLSRSHWLIRNPPADRGNGGGHVFTTLIGRNLRTGGSRVREFYPLDSATGREIFRSLKHVSTDQPSLFDCLEDAS